MATTWTLIIAILALVVSVANLLWNVASRFLHPKARMRVNVVFNTDGWVEAGVRSPISLEIVNFGPTDCALRGIALIDESSSLSDHKMDFRLLQPMGQLVDGGLPISDDQPWPRILKSGDLCHVEIPVLSGDYGSRKPISIGFLDTFGRVHTVKSTHFERVRDALGLPR